MIICVFTGPNHCVGFLIFKKFQKSMKYQNLGMTKSSPHADSHSLMIKYSRPPPSHFMVTFSKNADPTRGCELFPPGARASGETPKPAAHRLCGLRQVSEPFCGSGSSFTKWGSMVSMSQHYCLSKWVHV